MGFWTIQTRDEDKYQKLVHENARLMCQYVETKQDLERAVKQQANLVKAYNSKQYEFVVGFTDGPDVSIKANGFILARSGEPAYEFYDYDIPTSRYYSEKHFIAVFHNVKYIQEIKDEQSIPENK